MTTVDQGMSVEEIERVIAERVANAIEAIAIYETKTNMARKSISQTEQQECKLAENANNKRKWEGNHNGQCTVKFGNCKKVDHMTQDCRNPAAVRNQRTHACYECGSLRYFKSECPIVKFQKRVDKKIRTLAERQTENKRKFENTSRNSQNQQQQQIKRQNTGRAIPVDWVIRNHMGVLALCSKVYGKCLMLVNNQGNTIEAIAMNVGIKGTAGVIAQSERTETMKTKLEVLEHVERCMP
ncbi:reverse transcriptase domain-containing protein [Tanacetum coccineum]